MPFTRSTTYPDYKTLDFPKAFCGGNCLVHSIVYNTINATIANYFFLSESCVAAYAILRFLRAVACSSARLFCVLSQMWPALSRLRT